MNSLISGFQPSYVSDIQLIIISITSENIGFLEFISIFVLFQNWLSSKDENWNNFFQPVLK